MKAKRMSVVSTKPQKPNPLSVSSKNINSFKTRNIHTVIEDLNKICHANKNAVAKILLARGVARLFKQKSSLGKMVIALKDQTRTIHEMIEAATTPSKKRVKENKDIKDYYLLLGELNALIKFRRQLQELTSNKGMQMPEDQVFKNLLQISAKELMTELKKDKK